MFRKATDTGRGMGVVARARIVPRIKIKLEL
jgi:hypothetical protein